ncbi:MAG TPA: hypothetical protein VKG82_00270 [Solirubrobacteraceae bacterium]|nr:hypothetical protein [Solirubrobacteraceae bacterium]
MVLLLVSAFWILVLSLVACLCITARDGDLQHSRPPSPGVREPMDPSGVVTITRVKQREQTAPAHPPANAVALSPQVFETPRR